MSRSRILIMLFGPSKKIPSHVLGVLFTILLTMFPFSFSFSFLSLLFSLFSDCTVNYIGEGRAFYSFFVKIYLGSNNPRNNLNFYNVSGLGTTWWRRSTIVERAATCLAAQRTGRPPPWLAPSPSTPTP
jgi:hypothetical protein